MEEIHKSFSKNDMIELIEIFKMDIDYFDLSKTKLSSKLLAYIQEHEEFTPKKEYFINSRLLQLFCSLFYKITRLHFFFIYKQIHTIEIVNEFGLNNKTIEYD